MNNAQDRALQRVNHAYDTLAATEREFNTLARQYMLTHSSAVLRQMEMVHIREIELRRVYIRASRKLARVYEQY
jgi:hypothetical protein